MLIPYSLPKVYWSLLFTLAMPTCLKKLERAAAKLDCGEGLVILSDFPLGTPFNTALRLQSGAAVQHLTGMSMPMLLAILRDRADPSLTAEKLSERALAAAAKESFSVNQFIKALGEQTL